MNDFGPKRPMSESAETAPTDTAKAKRGRPKKKPTMTEKRKLKPFKPGRWNFSLNPTMTESNHLKMLQASERCEYNIVKGAEDVDYRRGLQHETQP